MNDRFYLINAPAGSGKTTFIHNKILELSLINSKCKILCITYTNRAADELINRFKYNDNNLHVYTIHSFISKFIQDYFGKKEVIDFYFELYGNEIKKIINSPDEEKNKNKIDKYKEKYGDNINYDVIRNNIESLYYNETNYNSYLYGGLSHDNLIEFVYLLSEKYQSIQFKLANLFNYIFIDEYQDTPSSVLKLFYNSLRYSNAQLFLFGDKMQQIYDKYDVSFDDILHSFNKSIKLSNNYRSSERIVNVLNNIYHDKEFLQSAKGELINYDSKILCVFTDDYSQEISKYPNYYKLFLLNKEKYGQIGSTNLYDSISSIEQYSYNGKYSVSDALNSNIDENSDILFKPMYLIKNIIDYYRKNNYGAIVRIITKYKRIFNENNVTSCNFKNIETLKKLFNNVALEYENNENSILDFLIKTNILNEEYYNFIVSNEDYERVLNTKLIEFKNYCNYTIESDCSTQHGVKGEGHDNIIFVSESSANPNVQMYEFYNYFCKKNIDVNKFEKFNDAYLKYLLEIEKVIDTKINSLTAGTYAIYVNQIELIIDEMYNEFYENELFELLEKKYFKYIANKNVTNLKNLLKKGNVSGILTAYKIFYVGCSRAKKNLVLLISKQKTSSYREDLSNKLKSIGFDIEIV